LKEGYDLFDANKNLPTYSITENGEYLF